MLLPAGASRVLLLCYSALGFRPSRHPLPAFVQNHSAFKATSKCNAHDIQRRAVEGDRDLWEKETPREQRQDRRAPRETAAPGAQSSSTVAKAVSTGPLQRQVATKNRAGRSRPQEPQSLIGIGQHSPPLEVLHLNEDFAVVSKPPRMHCHRPEFGGQSEEFLLQKARNQLGRRVFLPHRLDRGTSGCLLVGFSSEAVKVLHQSLTHPSSSKTYVAIVRGSGESFVGKGWFTVDRPIKDDKKVLREASTRFLFVRGGDDPDPRCCLVLAQPSTGRFHQIRRHLNGLNHPVVGDSVHGSSRFNREVVGHQNPAPAGRLMLHCLRLRLPALPNAGSREWTSAGGGFVSPAATTDDRTLEKDCRGSKGTSENVRVVREGNGEGAPENDRGTTQKAGLGNAVGVNTRGMVASSLVSEEVQTPAETERVVSNTNDAIFNCSSERDSGRTSSGSAPCRDIANEPFVSKRAATSGGADISLLTSGKESGGPSCREHGVAGEMEQEELLAEGLQVYAKPPDDMMTFLRGMSWWEEGLF